MIYATQFWVSQKTIMYLRIMFVRRKSNRSGSTSVVVVKKSHGKVCYLKTIGTSSDEKEIDELYAQGKNG